MKTKKKIVNLNLKSLPCFLLDHFRSEILRKNYILDNITELYGFAHENKCLCIMTG